MKKVLLSGLVMVCLVCGDCKASNEAVSGLVCREPNCTIEAEDTIGETHALLVSGVDYTISPEGVAYEFVINKIIDACESGWHNTKRGDTIVLESLKYNKRLILRDCDIRNIGE